MTIWEVLHAGVRRWYVLVLATMTGLMGVHLASGADGVYWSRSEVTFLAPPSAMYPNTLTTRSSDLIITAGVVAKRINGNLRWNKMADPAASIVGEGVREGWAVRLPDHGGQWSRVFPRQVLDVQVSGPTAQIVLSRQRDLLERIDAELAQMQEGVVESDRITTEVVPATPSVYYIEGRPTRALVMIWVLCAAGALAVILSLERRSSSRLASPSDGLGADDPALRLSRDESSLASS